MSADTKICPDCAEEVKAAARVCRFCRHRFEGSQPPPSQPPPSQPRSSSPASRGAIQRLRRSRPAVKLLAAAGIVALVLAAVAAYDHESAARSYNTCKRQVQPAMLAVQALESRVVVGLNQGAYSDQVGNTKAAVDRVDVPSLEPECKVVAGALSQAADIHAAASQDWNECITDDYCDEPRIEPYWDKATNSFAWARHLLKEIRGGDVDAADLAADEAAKRAVRIAASAMETYATDNNDSYVDPSYAGAGPAALARIEPALKGVDLVVGHTAYDGFELTVTSATGNRFTVIKEAGASGRCSKPGNAGCPQSGFWYAPGV
jgi:hypothetical protein